MIDDDIHWMVEKERDDLRAERDRYRDVLREWLAASDELRAVDTSDPAAIRRALDRVDAAKRDARASTAKREGA